MVINMKVIGEMVKEKEKEYIILKMAIVFRLRPAKIHYFLVQGSKFKVQVSKHIFANIV